MELQQFRAERMCKAAEKAGVDLLVASLQANIAYITGGYRSVGQDVLVRTQSYAIYQPGGDRVCYVMSVAEIPSILEHDPQATIYSYGGFEFDAMEGSDFGKQVLARREKRYPSPEDALAAAIQESGARKVALDESRVSFPSYGRLTTLLPGVELSPGTPVFMEARKIKHADEIAGIKKSTLAAEQALAYALAGFKVGMTEQDLELRYREEAQRLGGNPYFFVATAAHRAAFSDTTNTPLAVNPGDMIRFDFGVILDGYCSDLARTAVLGKPSEKILRYYQGLKAGTENAIAAMKPGVTAGAIFDIAVGDTRKNGIPHYKRHHCGHGIGLEAYDLLSIAPGNEEPLEVSMVFCIETPYYELGWGGLQIEDTVVVTEAGAVYLDEGSRDLIIL